MLSDLAVLSKIPNAFCFSLFFILAVLHNAFRLVNTTFLLDSNAHQLLFQLSTLAVLKLAQEVGQLQAMVFSGDSHKTWIDFLHPHTKGATLLANKKAF